MNDFLKYLAVAVVASFTLFLVIIGSTLFGAVSGWVVGLAFDTEILGITTKLGIQDITMSQCGNLVHS